MFYLLSIADSIDDTREFRVLEWHRAPGDRCDIGALLVELESYKAVIEIRGGLVAHLRKILVAAGGTQGRGKPLALFSDASDEPLPESVAQLPPLPVDYSFF